MTAAIGVEDLALAHDDVRPVDEVTPTVAVGGLVVTLVAARIVRWGTA